jgi:carbon monoxide dehydrogenase subunit G
MEFRIDTVLPATSAELWAIFFDVQRVATLIPGCENVTEVEPLKEFAAVMKQKIGPFKLEVPTRITVESHTVQRQVVLVAAGSDRFTGTTLDVRLKVDLEEQPGSGADACRLAVDASMQVAGRLASLGYPIVKKRSEELFGEFERRLRRELSGLEPVQVQVQVPSQVPQATSVDVAAPLSAQPTVHAPAQPSAQSSVPLPAAAGRAVPAAPVRERPRETADDRSRPVELVFQWPRVGISVAVGLAVAHGAVAFGQSPWWWLAAPLLGMAAGLGRRQA